ncbi:MAG: sn-glycerol-3-phosphate ABC transporter ATP-binding protein UgpC [Eubacteriales bacterium]
MAGISIRKLAKHYDGPKKGTVVKVIEDLDLEIHDKEFIILVGPSGCGKSTTLRMIAGLEEITSGEMYIGDRLINDVTPKDRDIAMVFQNYALYPNMTVYKNIAFSLQIKKVEKNEIDRRVNEVAKILNLEELLNRKPKALSGGQRQRVALGRAMVRNPAVFLLDEPLSNLDAKLRTAMRAEITRLHKRLNTTFVYVTHDQTEAMTMGDRIVVMDKGVIQQVDTPQNLYESPCNLFVAGFIGSPQMNTFPCNIAEKEGNYYAEFEGFSLKIDTERFDPSVLKAHVGKNITFGIRPEYLEKQETYIENPGDTMINTTLELSELMGAEINLYSLCGDKKIVSKTPIADKIADGEKITLLVEPTRVHLFDTDSGKSLRS